MNEQPKVDSPDRFERAWQVRTLPFMMRMLVALTGFFLVASLVQLFYLHGRIEREPKFHLQESLRFSSETGGVRELNGVDKLQLIRWQTLAAFEEQGMTRAYHQGKALLLARIWMQYLCFVTGIVLAMVGATFIIGKLREPQTEMEVKGGAVPFMIKTSTPGLVLVALGTLMMLSPVFSHQNILIQDASTYLKLWYLDGVSHDDRIRDFSDSTLPDSSGTVDSNEVEAAILREQMRKQQK